MTSPRDEMREREKFKELCDLLDNLRPGTGPAIEMFLNQAYDLGRQAAVRETVQECAKIAEAHNDEHIGNYEYRNCGPKIASDLREKYGVSE